MKDTKRRALFMQSASIHRLNILSELKALLDSNRNIKLYGAGYYLSLFLDNVVKINPQYLEAVDYIIVSNISGVPEAVKGISVYAVATVDLKPDDCVILTLGHRFTNEIYHLLKNTGVQFIELDFNMFQEIPYQEVEKSIRPFIDDFPKKLLNLNKPIFEKEIKAWTCWWQGEEEAPEIVKICWKSQKKNLPEGTKHIIITKDNYREYITLPQYIIKKVMAGDITFTHLSDIIRVNLLYKYGGFWLDAAVYVLEPLDENIPNYPIYTRNLPETQFCAKAMWTIGFLYAKPGNKLFQFLSEGFFYYFSVNDRLKHYFTLDYMIAIACNTFPDIEKQFNQIPYNNERAFELRNRLTECFDNEKYEYYIKGTFLQMLTYKLNQADIEGDTIYKHIISSV